ncbi:MAG: apolipoprotein N-acyltransferase, partial [Chlamydiales bacterium]
PTPWSRFGMAFFSWLLIVISMPGMGRHDGFGHIAFVALIPWALVCSRPGRRAFLAEWGAAAIGLFLTYLWMRMLLPWLVPIMGAVPALYAAASGILLRRLARRYPLAVAVPVAWMASELTRWLLPVPLSFGWWRLGTMSHDSLWFAGSARIWGVWGLSYVFAAFAGGVADWLRARELERRWSLGSKVAGFGPLLLAVAFSFLIPPPASRPGPSILMVQPGIEQKLKTYSNDPLRELFLPNCTLTFEALAEIEAAGEPAPDLVAWGESMLTQPVVEASALEGVAAGMQPLEWAGWKADIDGFESLAARERVLVQGLLFGQTAEQGRLAEVLRSDPPAWAASVLAGRPLLPQGSSFFCGAESIFAHEGAIRRRNAGFIWDAEGRRSEPAPKVNLVPGAEDLRGFQHLDFMLDIMLEMGGYIPDLVAADETVVLPLTARDGETYAMATTICFDNSFDDAYMVPMRREPVDFHLVASNEAWYESTVEMDQMAAFSRLIAQSTGRSVVRVTNSGISMVLGPSGAELAVLEVDGQRKMVAGTLQATIPVPVRGPGGEASTTFYVRTEIWQLWGWGLAILVLAYLAGNSDRNRGPEPG